jgi:RNA polymerase sigma-70 factor (ECF subfamily)
MRDEDPARTRIGRVRSHEEVDDLEAWLKEGYARSFRTACLILGNRSDAEEAVQEAYLRAWRFRASLATGADVKPWLYRVVVNTCNSKLRDEIPHRDRRSDGDHLDGVSSIEDLPGRVARSQDVARALQDLPLHLRVVVVLRYYADLSEREIATAIGRRQGTVKSRLHEGRRLLAQHPALRSETGTGSLSESGDLR